MKTVCYAAWYCKMVFVIILFECIIIFINTGLLHKYFYCLLNFVIPTVIIYL